MSVSKNSDSIWLNCLFLLNTLASSKITFFTILEEKLILTFHHTLQTQFREFSEIFIRLV